MTMPDLPIREPDQILHTCARKLCGVQVSPHIQVILGCLLGEDWARPRLVEMKITPDGHMLGRCEGGVSFRAFLGASEDLICNAQGTPRSPGSTETRLSMYGEG